MLAAKRSTAAATAHAHANQTNKQMRTCCDCWHIKFGTIALGLMELTAVALILSGIIKQIINKNYNLNCDKELMMRLFLRCNSITFDWILVGDYFIALLLFTIAICILLLFLGILIKSPFLLLPHLLIQGIFLISSLTYFFIYARSYFYVDLYKQRKTFELMALLERMWLATLLLLLAAFQFYIFFTVIKCCLYLQDYQNERLRRIRQFEECSKRVRDAKESGLWRSTSWGGSIQKYIGEFDSGARKLKKRDKPVGHVQWNLQTNIEMTEPKNKSNPIEISKQLEEVENYEEIKPSSTVRSVSVRTNQTPKCYHGDTRRTTSLPVSTVNMKQSEKQLPKVVPIQRVNPTTTITTTIPMKQNESHGDNVKVFFNTTQGQSRNM